MIDIKLIRDNPERVKQLLARRGVDGALIDQIIQFDVARRYQQKLLDDLRSQKRTLSKQIGINKARGESVTELLAASVTLDDTIIASEAAEEENNAALRHILHILPNLPDETLPVGTSSEDNRIVRTVGTPRKFDFEPKPHWELGEALGLLDFERAAKISGARFVLYRGAGAALERALINFMLDTQTKVAGYTEIIPPLMVNATSAFGTGNLPKFEEDLFKTNTGHYLIPTAEVPVTNIHQGEILEENDLPIKYTAYTPCFRSEAGSAGRDTRGIIRLHQFNKIEVVKFAHPDHSMAELELLTKDAERILQLLELPYRVVELCTGDIGFSSARTYDLEVFLPSYNDYKEISSCSNFMSFQARRMNTRFRRADGSLDFVHTLNGSGLAVGRTFAAILENYQEADGSIRVPKVLLPYLTFEVIKKA